MNETSELVVRLQQHGRAIAEEATERMYQNPFWSARFGARGRQHSIEDARHHLSYARESIVLEEPEVFGNYARWLRSVLVSRGMCSRHLIDHFSCMSAVVDGFDLGPERARVQAMFLYGVAALRYPSGLAAELQDRLPALVERSYRQLQSLGLVAAGGATEARCRDDIAYHGAYLLDALALDRPEVFAAYAAWMARFLESFAVPCEHLLATLRGLGDAMQPELVSADLATVCRTLLTSAIEAIGQKRARQ